MADPIIRDMLAEQAYGSIYSSQYADAQKSARANEIARRIGIAPDLVEQALPDMMAEDRLRRATEEARRNAAYARMMANPRLAAAGIDDEHLPKVAREAGDLVQARNLGVGGAILQYGKELIKGFGQGSASFYRLAQGAVESAAEAIPDNSMTSGLKEGLQPVADFFGRQAGTVSAMSRPIRTDNRVLNDIYSGAQSVGPSAMALALTAITRKPITAASIIGAQTAGQSYQEGREAGLTPIQSLSYGAQQAVPEIGFEALGGRVFSESVQLGMPFAKTLARQLGIELATELPTTAVQSLFRFSNIGAPKEGQTVGEWLSGLPDEELSTAIAVLSSVGFTTTIATGATRAAERYAGIVHDRSTAAAVDRIMEASAQSTTRQSNPSDFEEALNQLVGDGDAENLYVPADKVQELFQTEDGTPRDIHDDAFWSQYAGQVEEAAALGGDVVIPLASAATHLAGSTDWAKLREFVRTRPGGASLAEAKQAQSPDELEKMASDLAAHRDERLPQMKAQALTKAFASGLGYEGDEADAVSGLLAAGLGRAHAIENAKRESRGEQPIPIEEFAAGWLPTPQKMTQAEYDATGAAPETEAPVKGRDALAVKPQGTDVITFVRRLGGIRDDEGHNLGKGRGYLKRPGLISKRGRSVDSVGEALWEAGYFGAGQNERPTEAQVLDLIERGFHRKVYRPHDVAVADRFEGSESEESARARIREAAANFRIDPSAPVEALDLTAEDEDMALSFLAEGATPAEAAFAAWEHRIIHGTADLLDEVAAEGVSGHDYEGAANRLRASLEGSGNRSEQGTGDENDVPGFDDARDAGLGGRPKASGDGFFQVLNQLFEEPDQPHRTMTQAQRAELEARLMQSMSRRGGQQSVKDQEGGLFSAERDQDTLFQTAQTETPEFKRWFGDSKVVDENGRPLVVYHGSPDARFMGEDATFKGPAERYGIGEESGVHWFTKDRAVAATYAVDARAFDYQNAEPQIIPTFLKMENPLVIEANGKAWREAQSRGKTRDVIDQAKEDGHDGVIIRNVRDDYSSYEGNRTGKATDTYAVFDSRQIKSAIGNRGTFDPTSPSILADTQSRGNISIARDEQGLMSGAVIRAFEAANFSTAVHEIGHFFIEDLKRRALTEGATEQEAADWQAFKAWAAENGHALDGETIPTEAHEMWARGFERYIYEGKAPSSALTRLFSRMRDFMLSLYRSVTSFNSPITPEIRQVMDRLLASDEEIAAQTERLRLNDAALADLMSADEQTQYAELGAEARETARDKLFERVLSTLRAEKERGFRDQKRQIRSEVAAAVEAEPVFQALKLLRSGVPQEDGTTARATLSREWLVDTYGEDIIDELPKSVPPIIDDAHAADPEVLASQAGFESADAMVNALKAHEQQRRGMKAGGDKRSPRQMLIDEGTDARAKAELGDPFQNLEEEAEAALANEKQADRISLELRALARKVGKRPTAWQAANEWARNRVRSQSTKEAISGSAMQMYSRAAAKAAQRVEDALAKQDFDEAFLAKQQQVLNLALMAQAKKAKDEVDKAVRRMQRTASRDTIASVDQDYLDQAHQLLEAVDMRTRPQTHIDKRLAFEAWYAAQVEKGVDVLVPPEYARTLGQTNWSRLAIAELLELDKAVGQVIELGRLKQRLKDGKKSRDYNEGVAEMEFSGGQQPPRTKGKTTDPSRSLPSRIRSKLRLADAAMIKIETLTRWLDNNDPNGPWTRYLFRPIAEAQGRETDLLRDYTKDINALIKGMPKGQARGWTRIVDTPELVIRNRNHLSDGEAWSGTKDQVVAMALNWGNDQNRQRLLDGFGWNEAAMEAVFDRLMTKEDWDFVQGVWDTVDKLWPDIAALEREVNGVAPEKVEAAEVQTRHGTYRGGYFPIVYDPTQSTHAAQAEEDRLSPNGGWFTATTRSSATKARVEAVKGRPLLLTMSVITRHVGEVVHDITHRQAVSQAKKLLSDSRVHAIINSRLGPEYSKAMGAWIENVARPNSAFSKDNPALVALGRHLNKGVSLVGLGFRITTSLVQLLGIPVAGGELGSKYLWQGVSTAAAHPVKTYNEIVARSAEMRARFQTLDAVIDDMIREQGSGKLQVIGPKGISKYAFQGIAYMDMVVTTSVWTGAFNKAIAEGMTEEEAALYGDKVVRMTQGTGGMKDRSGIQNAHPLVRSLYPFFSYMNALYNMQRDIFRRVAQADSAADYAEAARRAWWVMAVPTLLQALLFGNGPDDDDDGVTAGDWAEYLVKSVILGNLGSLPLIGNLAAALGEGYTYRSSAYQQIGEGFVEGYTDTKKLATGEDEQLKGSTIQSVLTTVGIIAAKPLGQIGATSRGIYDLATGEAEPEDAGDVYELLTKGRISKQPTSAERLMGETE